MKNSNKQKKALFVISALEELYPEAECALKYEGDPYKLLVMAVLSAQCTDKRVNEVSIPLFEKYPVPELMANSPEGELEGVIRPVGLYNSKAKNLRAACKRLCEVYGGTVPTEMEDLLSLGGVGRKVANLLRGDLYGLGGIVADTHCIRISARLGLTASKAAAKSKNYPSPLETERALSKLVPLEKQSDFCHRLVLFGREICDARSPKCKSCPLSEHCQSSTESAKEKT